MIYFIYLCIILFTAAQSASTKLYTKCSDNSTAFNIYKALSAFVIFLAVCLYNFQTHTGTLAFGLLHGLLLSVSMYTGYKALTYGPMLLTSLIVSFSVVIPLFYGVIFCNEALNTYKIIGLILLTAAIVFSNLNKPQDSTKSANLKWSIYLALTFICNGFSSIIQKVHQSKYNSMYCSEFMLYAMLACSVIYLAMGFTQIRTNNPFKSNGKRYGIFSGIATAISGYSTIRLAGFENASILFPAISAGTILCTLLAGIIIFKEKLRYNHIIALVSGIAAVVFLKL